MNKTLVRIVTVALALLVASPSAYADTLFRRSIDKAAAEAAQTSRRQAARDQNPHKVLALSLIGAGATLAILGFVTPAGVECSDVSTSRTYSVECGTKANKGLLFSGAGAIGLGGILYMKGERQRSTPSITPTAGGVVVRQRVRF